MKDEVIAYSDPKSPVSEMFKTLRTNIQFMNSNKPLKTLLVTSTLPGEGKSWTTANLAVTFAQAGKKVLIIDADMRKGRQFSIFEVPPAPGLSNYLSDIVDGETVEQDLDYFIKETEIENLDILVAGNVPPNPTELLVSERMLELIKDVEEMYDITIFDGTPGLIVADASILSRIVDSSIIVTAHNETKIDNVSEVKKSIENIGGKVAGVVINKIPASSKKYEKTYYYYGHTNMPAVVKDKKKKKHKSKFEEIEDVDYYDEEKNDRILENNKRKIRKSKKEKEKIEEVKKIETKEEVDDFAEEVVEKENKQPIVQNEKPKVEQEKAVEQPEVQSVEQELMQEKVVEQPVMQSVEQELMQEKVVEQPVMQSVEQELMQEKGVEKPVMQNVEQKVVNENVRPEQIEQQIDPTKTDVDAVMKMIEQGKIDIESLMQKVKEEKNKLTTTENQIQIEPQKIVEMPKVQQPEIKNTPIEQKINTVVVPMEQKVNNADVTIEQKLDTLATSIDKLIQANKSTFEYNKNDYSKELEDYSYDNSIYDNNSYDNNIYEEKNSEEKVIEDKIDSNFEVCEGPKLSWEQEAETAYERIKQEETNDEKIDTVETVEEDTKGKNMYISKETITSDFTLDKTQEILDEINKYLDEERKKFRNGGLND